MRKRGMRQLRRLERVNIKQVKVKKLNLKRKKAMEVSLLNFSGSVKRHLRKCG